MYNDQFCGPEPFKLVLLMFSLDILLKPSKRELQQDDVQIHVLKRSDSPPEMYNDQFCSPEPFKLILLMFCTFFQLTYVLMSE